MKVKFILSSSFISPKQEEYNYNNPIEIDWKLPFLPRLNEFVDMDSIIPNDIKKQNAYDLMWEVTLITFYNNYIEIVVHGT